MVSLIKICLSLAKKRLKEVAKRIKHAVSNKTAKQKPQWFG
jgi:hypothetical protein